MDFDVTNICRYSTSGRAHFVSVVEVCKLNEDGESKKFDIPKCKEKLIQLTKEMEV
jgi:hypothetical protein